MVWEISPKMFDRLKKEGYISYLSKELKKVM